MNKFERKLLEITMDSIDILLKVLIEKGIVISKFTEYDNNNKPLITKIIYK